MNINPEIPQVEFHRGCDLYGTSPVGHMVNEQFIIEVVRLCGAAANPIRDYNLRGYQPSIPPKWLMDRFIELASVNRSEV